MKKNSSMRGVVAGGVIAGVALTLGVGGVGYAANGGSFILGQTNNESATATLKNSTGTPLKLVAPAGKAPLAVSNPTKVLNLNADQLDGLDSSALQRKGTTVRVSDPTYSPSEGPFNRQARAYCLAGEHAVGGGGHVSALTADRLGEYYNFIVHSAPISSATGEPAAGGAANGWLVESSNLASQINTAVSGKDANLYAYVICAPN